MTNKIWIVGGGLSGCEAAWQVAKAGFPVQLFEMRPKKKTGAHATSNLAELVCSNSLGSNLPDRATGLLQAELRILGSLLLECATQSAVPAGGALAVDREAFSQTILQKLESLPNLEIIREEVLEIPENQPAILASGPLTSPALSEWLGKLTGQNHLYFFDALSPIVLKESVDLSIAFRASRRDSSEEGDYLNCPFTKDEYQNFVAALLGAERQPLKEFESAIESGVKAHTFFEGCLPVEIIASRGEQSLAFGPMRPIGLIDPRTGKRPYAVVQLRQDNLAGSLYNLVGFQTNLKYGEQERVFRLIPGLQNAEFVRLGQMHRNTFLNSPTLLNENLSFKNRPYLFAAGQITGVEGYMGNIATGLWAGKNMVAHLKEESLVPLPKTTMLGALLNYISHAEAKHFQPMKANFGILPELGLPLRKHERAQAYSKRALEDLKE